MKSVNRARIVGWLALLTAAAVLVGGRPAGAGLQSSSVGPGDPVARALDGAIDIHVHSFPDNTERSIDALEVSMLSRARGMRGLVLKNHYDPTSGLAYMVRKQVAGLEVFGGVDLNLPVGGMNAAAVEHMAQVSGGYGRVVWMSTFDAENQVRYSKDNRPFVRVSKGGELLPATKGVIAAIAKHGMILATGHVSAEEGLMLLREGRRLGVAHMVVTHAMNAPILMNVAQMQEATKQGAFIEFAGGAVGGATAAARIDKYADAIRMIGPDFCILSSDLGQKGNALPPEGFAAFVLELRARGFSDQDLDRMSKVNPARLLGLK
jgi:hypothetical protein